VLRRLPRVRFRLIGTEEPADGEYHQLARQLGVLDRVEFVGTVPRESLPAAYADADVLAVPSLAEGHALAPLEAVASGTPVVGSDIPGIRETVEDGVNGLLVPPGDPAALADALCRALGDAALLDRLTRAARPSAERFSWDARIREFPALVERVRQQRQRHA
jgi:glycosyltransferase involved in cell wall biosynthesis